MIEDERAYQMLWELVDRIETIEAVREGLKEVEEGRTLPLAEARPAAKKSMEYEIDVTDTAFAEIDNAYQWIKEWAPDAAESWYEGLMTALRSLRQNPRRCPRTFATNLGYRR